MSEPKRNPQARRWMLTLNNPSFRESEIIYNLCTSENIKYACWCAENEDEENHTPHYHIYLSFKKPWRFNRIKDILPRADIEKAIKPELACFRYLTKGNREHTIEPFYMEFGQRNQNSHKKDRNNEDLAREEVIQKVRNKRMRYEELSNDQMLDSKLCTAVERILRITLGPQRNDLHICCFVSPTGWGKSFSVWDTFEEVTTVEFGASQEWFISPEKEVALFDEFCGQIRCQKMLKYLDKYPIALPIKGGHRPCYWRAIFICSNTRPDEWYTKEDEKTGLRTSTIPDDVRKALYRRIGYDGAINSHGETHVFDPVLYTLDQAREEMKQITLRIKAELEHSVEHEQLIDDIQSPIISSISPPIAAAAAAVDDELDK